MRIESDILRPGLIAWILMLFFIQSECLYGQLMECSAHPGGMMITDSAVIKDCGIACIDLGRDSICLGDNVIFKAKELECGSAYSSCEVEYMLLAFDPNSGRHTTRWQRSGILVMHFDQEGTWHVRICARSITTKEGLCETSALRIHVIESGSHILARDTTCGLDSIDFEVFNIMSGVAYHWEFGPNSIPETRDGPGPHSIKFKNEGIYNIELESSFGRGCSWRDTHRMVIGNPEISLGIDQEVCILDSIEICEKNEPKGGKFEWENGDTGTCRIVFPNEKTNVYSLTYTDQYGCQDNDELILDADTCSKVGNYVWLDIDTIGSLGIGIQDRSEVGLQNVIVKLKDVYGITIQSTSTDSDGYYEHCIPPGEYYLEFDFPSRYQPTTPNSGVDDSLDSDVTGAFGPNTTDLFIIGRADTNLTIDLGLVHSTPLPVSRIYTRSSWYNEDFLMIDFHIDHRGGINSLVCFMESDNFLLVKKYGTEVIKNGLIREKITQSVDFIKIKIAAELNSGDVLESKWESVEGNLMMNDKFEFNQTYEKLTLYDFGKYVSFLIYNTSGLKIIEFQVEAGADKIEIDLSRFSPGSYVVSGRRLSVGQDSFIFIVP